MQHITPTTLPQFNVLGCYATRIEALAWAAKHNAVPACLHTHLGTKHYLVVTRSANT